VSRIDIVTLVNCN